MVDPHDIEFMRTYVSLSCRFFSDHSANAVKAMGESVRHQKTSALVQETNKTRDTIFQMSQSNLCKLFPEHVGKVDSQDQGFYIPEQLPSRAE
jgi:hypothetical protein